jgi:PAS domain S-box-containing protein
LHIDYLKDSKTISDFLLVESINPDFYLTGQSMQLMNHYRINERILKTIQTAKHNKKFNAFNIKNELNILSARFNSYNILFDSIVYLTYKRGYDDFGLQGEMNDYVSQLEKINETNNDYLIQLRDNEMKYFHWHDSTFLKNFRNLTAKFKRSIVDDPILTASQSSAILNILENYSSSFERLVSLDYRIGLTNNANLTASLNKTGQEIEQIFVSIAGKSTLVQKSLIRNLNHFYYFYLVFIIGFCILAGIVISKRFVSHLEKLTLYISNLTRNKFNYNDQVIDFSNSAIEITQIYTEFRIMLAQLQKWEKQHDALLKNAEENQRRYQELADMLPQSIFETDNRGNYTYANKAWFKTFHYTSEDLKKGINLNDTLISASADNILNSSKLEDSIFRAVRKNKTYFEASVYADNIIVENRISGKRGIIIDISDKVRYIRELKDETSKALTSDQLKSSFLANMSHEIRTPMNSIIGFSNLLASDEVPEDQKKEFVHYIQSSGEILLNLVDDIIDIAKIEAGELKIIKKECNLTGLLSELNNTFNEIKKRINKPLLEINLLIENEIHDVTIKTDPFRLRQILSNLIGNAIKFTEQGEVEFGFKVISADKIKFFVKDTGVGLTREELDIIFERFKRSRHSEEKNIIGTGLGLAISKNLVELLGGEMWVDSSPGKGTTFFFTLPFLKITRQADQELKQEFSEDDYNWKGKGILIVEDDHHSMNFLSEVLKKTQATIMQASSGDIALQLCHNTEFLNLIIMDIQLPGMNGIEVTRLIKKIKPHVPVIAQTAYAMAGDQERITMAGFDDYVSKPLDIKVLLSKINHLMITSQHTLSISPSPVNN